MGPTTVFCRFCRRKPLWIISFKTIYDRGIFFGIGGIQKIKIILKLLYTCVLCVTHYIFKFAVGLATKTVKFYGIQIIMEAPNLILGIDHQAESLKINFQLQISYFYKEYFFCENIQRVRPIIRLSDIRPNPNKNIIFTL